MTNEPSEPRYHPQILIVEDDPDIRNLMKLVIEREDHWQTSTVTCGANAVEACEKTNYDLIIMDLRLPLMDGIEAAKYIRQNEELSGRKRTPILAFTAAVTDEDRRKCKKAGIDDFIAKPASLKMVVDVAYKYLPGAD